MSALINDPKVSTHGDGRYGVRFTRFVLSASPGGYSPVQVVDLFPTREERDAYVRGLRREHRGNRRTSPIIESFDVEVAELRWFAGPYHRLVLLADQAEGRYGFVRIYDTNPPVYEVRYAEDEEDLRWMLAAQWEDAYPEAGEPRAPYDVYFFTEDEPIRLKLILEPDAEREADK